MSDRTRVCGRGSVCVFEHTLHLCVCVCVRRRLGTDVCGRGYVTRRDGRVCVCEKLQHYKLSERRFNPTKTFNAQRHKRSTSNEQQSATESPSFISGRGSFRAHIRTLALAHQNTR